MNICFLGLLFLLWCHLVFIMPHHMTPGRLVTQQKMQLEMSLESWRVEGAGAWEGHTQWALLAADHFLLPYVAFIWWYSMRYCDSDIYLRIYIYMYICRQIYTYRHLFSCSTSIWSLFWSTFIKYISMKPAMSRQVESFRVDGPQRWCPRGGRCKSHLLHPLGKAPRGHGLWRNVKGPNVVNLQIFKTTDGCFQK